MRNYAIRKGTVSTEDIRRVAARLTAFYRNGIEIALDPAAYRGRFLHDIERNRRKLSRPKYRLPVERVHGMCRAQRAAFERRKKRFAERVRPGKIVEGHSDLRPEHICIAPEVAMIDCLGFTRDLRIVDPADEAGFLALKCERLGAGAYAVPMAIRLPRVTRTRRIPFSRRMYAAATPRVSGRCSRSGTARTVSAACFRKAPGALPREASIIFHKTSCRHSCILLSEHGIVDPVLICLSRPKSLLAQTGVFNPMRRNRYE